MRLNYPKVMGTATALLAIPLVGAVVVRYVASVASRPAADVYGFGLSAFGVSAALAAVCLSAPQSTDGSSTLRFGGEKFLHASLLLVQSLILVYCKSWLHDGHGLAQWPTVARVTSVVIDVLVTAVSAAAAYAWFWGFEAVDTQLWMNWANRRSS